MALPKQSIPMTFGQGLDTKVDPKQVQVGKFLELSNTIFQVGGLLQKRNGYGADLAALPDSSYTLLTTFNGDLTAIGTTLSAYASGGAQWVNKGHMQPLDLTVMPLIRNNVNQVQSDTAVSFDKSMVCTVYTEVANGTTTYKYAIADSVTGQNITAPTTITDANTDDGGGMRVFLLGNYFVIAYTHKVGAGNYNLRYIAVSLSSPQVATSPANISTSYTPATSVAFDAAVFNGLLYFAWNGAAASGIKMATLSTALVVSSTVIEDAAHQATMMSVSVDFANSIIYVAYNSGGTIYALSVYNTLALKLAPTAVIAGITPLNVTSSAINNVLTVFGEAQNNYSFDASSPTHFIRKNTVTSTGTVGSSSTLIRSVGLASKSFIINSTIYMVVEYSSNYQPTYFVIDSVGNIIAKLAYQNGTYQTSNTLGYLPTGIPNVSINDQTFTFSYLFKDLIASVNKNTNVPNGSQVNGIYSQTGINLAQLTLNTSISVDEIGTNLNLTGGITQMYDGYSLSEQGFNLYPDNIYIPSDSTTGGNMAAQKYFYQVTYEWTDNQGNAFRSAPSIPALDDLTGSGTSTNTVTIAGPMLRLTAKTANPVKIVIYRWSTAQQTYYQVTSLLNPILNDTTTDSWTFTDTQSDAAILGNNILYTNGGVVENIGPPASASMALFDTRLWLVDAEDRNLLWYSKQVIENTPVEMSDLFTFYIAPTTAAQGPTGPITAITALDDKLIIFKQNAIYYINGTGPDNTGANSQYSQPIFITSTVGCASPHSIVFMPQGLMFQSDKGIWLLGRDLSTNYIGAPVEQFNSYTVQSSVNVPATNQVRFTLANGPTLMYDYFYGQWGTFTGIFPISSTIYQGLHTYLDERGGVFQETPGLYLDGSNPVLMSFQSAWFNLAGLQGLERSYYFYLIGEYLSPHKINIQIAYDYAPAPSQTALISPDNFNPTWGGLPQWGSNSPWGGNPSLEQWRIFLKQQKCQSFQIYMNEVYDNSFGVPAGAGFTLSGLNIVAGIKKQYPTLRPGRSTG